MQECGVIIVTQFAIIMWRARTVIKIQDELKYEKENASHNLLSFTAPKVFNYRN